jgi:hypothetical protein
LIVGRVSKRPASPPSGPRGAANVSGERISLPTWGAGVFPTIYQRLAQIAAAVAAAGFISDQKPLRVILEYLINLISSKINRTNRLKYAQISVV